MNKDMLAALDAPNERLTVCHQQGHTLSHWILHYTLLLDSTRAERLIDGLDFGTAQFQVTLRTTNSS